MTAPERDPNPGFLGTIFRNVRLGGAIRAELEDDLSFLVRPLPGLIGYALRYLVYRLLFEKIESMPFISTNVKFMHMHKISLGRGVLINSNCYLYGKGGIRIGSGTLLSPNCVLVAGGHDIHGDAPILQLPSKSEPIVIGDDCWLGANVSVMGGVTIADGCVIGAGAVVTRDTEPYGIYAGVPARRIGARKTPAASAP